MRDSRSVSRWDGAFRERAGPDAIHRVHWRVVFCSLFRARSATTETNAEKEEGCPRSVFPVRIRTGSSPAEARSTESAISGPQVLQLCHRLRLANQFLPNGFSKLPLEIEKSKQQQQQSITN